MNSYQAPLLRFFSLCTFMFLCSSITAQEVTYLNKYRYPIKDLLSYEPAYLMVSTADGDKTILKIYTMDSVLRSEKHTLNQLDNKEHLLFNAEYDVDGDLKFLQKVASDKKVIIQDFYKNGLLRSEKIFLDDELFKESYFDEDGSVRNKIVEEHPEPHGGLAGWHKYLSKNLNYPKQARKRREQGVALLYFVIDEEGKIQDLDIKNPEEISQELSQEALRIINSYPHNWRPAITDGKPVKVEITLPLRFKIG